MTDSTVKAELDAVQDGVATKELVRGLRCLRLEAPEAVCADIQRLAESALVEANMRGRAAELTRVMKILMVRMTGAYIEEHGAEHALAVILAEVREGVDP